jgi:glycosyltransferase involved in cell wall biosynthesis
MTYHAAIKKLSLERMGMAPFVWMGKLAGLLFPLKTKHNVFLFFPNTDIGGAPKVNADITELLKNDHPIIIFSKKGQNNLYRERYEKTGVKIIDLHPYIDNKLFHFINFFFRGLLAAWINQQDNPVVFGGESIFFYKVIPHIRKDIRCVELTHVDVWMPYTIGFIDRIDARVFSTKKGMENVKQQYIQNQLPEHYSERLFFIDNAVDIPEAINTVNEKMEVFFIGRGSAQKRIHLVAAIAKAIHQKGLPVHFNFVGDVDKMIDPLLYPFCSFYGTITDETTMNEIYRKADVLLLTSSFEGLPVVIMQMMAYGKLVISTAVSGIPDYIFHQQNGLLLYAKEEEGIIAEGIQQIEWLLNEPTKRAALGIQARNDAISQFSRQSFERNYRRILCI